MSWTELLAETLALPEVLHCTCCHNGFSVSQHAWRFEDDGGTPGFGMCSRCNHGECYCNEFPEDQVNECSQRNMTKRCREARCTDREDRQ